MRRANVGFTSGLLGTQTSGRRTPVGGSPRFVPRFWAVGVAIGGLLAALIVLHGLSGFYRGSALADVRVDGGGASVTPGAGITVGLTASDLDTSSTATVPDWTPTPQPNLSMVADDRHRSMTWEQYQALQAFPEDQQLLFACIAYHESRWQTDAVGDNGRAHGAWQVHPRFWGPVPDDLKGQAEQAAEIASEYGSKPWTTSEACQ